MAKHLSVRRRLRLRRELETIRGAVEAARILGEAVSTSQLGPERDHRRAPRALTCLLSLVEDRLREVRRAARKLGDEPRRIAEQLGGEPWRIAEQLGGEPESRYAREPEPRHVREPEPRHVREPRGSTDNFRRMSANERVLATVAMRQRGSRVSTSC